MEQKKLTVEELAAATGKCTGTIYRIAKILGRLPTVEEVRAIKNGRPRKY